MSQTMLTTRTTRLAPDAAPLTVSRQYVTTPGEPDRIRVTIAYGPHHSRAGQVIRERWFLVPRHLAYLVGTAYVHQSNPSHVTIKANGPRIASMAARAALGDRFDAVEVVGMRPGLVTYRGVSGRLPIRWF